MFFHVEVGWLLLEDQGVVSKNDNLPPFVMCVFCYPLNTKGIIFSRGSQRESTCYGWYGNLEHAHLHLLYIHEKPGHLRQHHGLEGILLDQQKIALIQLVTYFTIMQKYPP